MKRYMTWNIKVELRTESVYKAKQVLIDNGISEDEAGTVLQALGFVLIGVDLEEFGILD